MPRIMTPKGWREIHFNDTALNESRAVADKAIKKVNADSEHVASHGHEHVYHGEGDGGTDHFMVHNTKTMKTHHVTLDHEGDQMSHGEVHSDVKSQHGSKIGSKAVKSIHKSHINAFN